MLPFCGVLRTDYAKLAAFQRGGDRKAMCTGGEPLGHRLLGTELGQLSGATGGRLDPHERPRAR